MDLARNDFRKSNKWPRSHAKCHVLCHTPENYQKVLTEINTARSHLPHGNVHAQMRNRREGLMAKEKLHFANIAYAQFQWRQVLLIAKR